MIDNILPSPAWQDAQMAAYGAALASEDEAGQKKIMATIVESFGPYLEFMAKAFCNRSSCARMMDYEDFLTIAKLALVRAMSRWRPEHGKQLSRLASRYIKGDIIYAIQKAAYGMMTVPQRTQRHARLYNEILYQDGEGQATEYLKNCNISRSGRVAAKRLATEGVKTIYIWQPVLEDSDSTLESRIADPRTMELMPQSHIQEGFELLVRRLTTQERFVLYMICPAHVDLPAGFSITDKRGNPVGIPSREELTGGARYKDVGRLLGVTRARIGQIVGSIREKASELDLDFSINQGG